MPKAGVVLHVNTQYVATSAGTMNEHRKARHKNIEAKDIRWRRIKVQTFYSRPVRRFFKVKVEGKPTSSFADQNDGTSYRSAGLPSMVEEQLSKKGQEMVHNQPELQSADHYTQISPWLEMIRWPSYLHPMGIADMENPYLIWFSMSR